MRASAPPRRIFIAAASDLQAERELAAQIVSELQHEAGDRDPFEPYRWEVQQDAWDAGKGYQEQIPKPSQDECEVLICLLGERAGSPLPDTFVLPEDFECPPGVVFPCRDEKALYNDGAAAGDIPLTGTFFEFLDARQAQQRTGRPHILLFIKGDASSVGQAGAPADERRWGGEKHYQKLVAGLGNRQRLPLQEDLEYRRQTTFLSRFFDRFLGNRGAVQYFTDEADLAGKLTAGLRDKLQLAKKSWRGNPYKHLERYEIGEAPVFFGRKDDTRKIVQRLSEADRLRDEGRIPMLLLEGESGSGKSSTLRAGLAAALKGGSFGATTGAAFRPRVVTASDLNAPDPFLALIAELASPDALPDLRAFVEQARARPVERRVERLIDEIARALPPGDGAGTRRRSRLLIAVDQFDEILRLEADETRRRWRPVLESLIAVAREGLGYTAIGLKSDAVELLRRWLDAFGLPNTNAFVAYLLDERDLDLDEVIERPFDACGLTVAADLRDHLRRQARQLRSLPLLSVALHNLYRAWEERRRTLDERQRRDPFARQEPVSPVLAVAEYEQEADLGGAIDKLGELAVVAAHTDPERTEEQLARLLRRLVSVPADAGAPGSATLVSCRLADVPEASRPLLEALRAHRLVIQEKGEEVRLVHLAVLEHWTRASAWLKSERTHLRTRAEFERALPLWLEDPTDENAGRMWDRYVDDAERMLVAWRDEPLPPDLRRFIVAAIRHRFDRGSLTTNENAPRLVDAVRLGDEALATYMLDRRADPNATSPLAVETPPGGEEQRSGGSTPLMFAADLGLERLARLLIARGADVTRVNASGVSALAYAAAHGHEPVVRLLHEECGAPADPHALVGAAFNGHDAVVDRLLAYDADADAPDRSGWTPLMAAAYAGRAGAIERLLKAPRPAAIDKDLNGLTPLILAAQQGHTLIVGLLLERGAAVARRTGDSGLTALMAAAANGHTDVVRALLADPRTEPNAGDTEGRTALHLSVLNGRGDAAAALLEDSRVDRTPLDVRGHTPLSLALSGGRLPLVQLLADAGGILPPWFARGADGTIVRLRGEGLQRQLETHLAAAAADASADASLSPSLLAGAWEDLQPSDAAALLARAAESAPDGVGCGAEAIRLVRVRPLTCHPGARLCEAVAVKGGTPIGSLTFVAHRSGVTWLDGTSPPIHQMNAAHPLDVGTPDRALEYVRFFCRAVHAELGAFVLAETAEELRWTIDSSAAAGHVRDVLRRCDRLPHSIRIAWNEPRERWECTAVLQYGGALFRGHFELDRSGMVTMVDDQPLADRLPLPIEVFVDGIRAVRQLTASGDPRIQVDLRPLVRMDVGDGSLDWPVPPLLPGDWTVVPPAEAASILHRAADDVPPRAEIRADAVDALRARSLPFYDGARLYEARVRQDGQVTGCLSFVRGARGTHWLDGHADVFSALNPAAPIRLRDEPAAAEYLRFFCAAVHSVDGAFSILDAEKDLSWPPGISAAQQRLVESLRAPVVCRRMDDGQAWWASAVVHYGAAVFAATFSITDAGKVEMLTEEPLASNVGAFVEIFEGGVRALRLPGSGAR